MIRPTLAGLVLAATCAAAQDSALPDRLVGHGGPIRAITVSADGARVLTASFDYALILWDIAEAPASVRRRLTGHAAAVNDAAFVPGRGWAVSVGDDGAMAAWDLAAGRKVWMTEVDAYKALDLSVSPTGRRAAMAKWDATARVIDLDTGAETARLEHRSNVNAVLLDGDDRLYTATHAGEIVAWNLAQSPPTRRPLLSHGWGVNALAGLPDGRILFGALDGTVGTVDPATGERTVLATSDRPVQSVKPSHDGALLGYGDGAGRIGVFTAAGQEVETGTVTYGPVWDFDFVPGTTEIYHVGLDDFAARWRIAPRDFAPIQAELPRRFQVRDTADPGEREFLRKCSVCHTLTPDDRGRAGPTLYKLFGRRAGGLAGYPYSEALASLDVVWTEATVAQLFDEGPDVMVPGTKMPIQRLKSVERRDALIRFLKTATAPVESHPKLRGEKP